MVFEGAGWTLRVRLAPREPGGAERVRSWTVALETGFPSLEAACDALSLSPSPPTGTDAALEPVLLRRALPDPRTREVHSLTARVVDGHVDSMTAFDEPPDWRAVAEPR